MTQQPKRYWLERELSTPPADDKKVTVAFVMLNPSTADDVYNDPTIRRCIGFAEAWGCHSLIVVNTNPMRSTNPKACPTPNVETLSANDTYLARAAECATWIVCAWGNNVAPNLGARAVLAMRGRRLYHLGLTKLGNPRHPLYLPKTLQVTPWDYECGEGYAHAVGTECRGQCVLRG